jgi:hypothetical protein
MESCPVYLIPPAPRSFAVVLARTSSSRRTLWIYHSGNPRGALPRLLPYPQNWELERRAYHVDGLLCVLGDGIILIMQGFLFFFIFLPLFYFRGIFILTPSVADLGRGAGGAAMQEHRPCQAFLGFSNPQPNQSSTVPPAVKPLPDSPHSPPDLRTD